MHCPKISSQTAGSTSQSSMHSMKICSHSKPGSFGSSGSFGSFGSSHSSRISWHSSASSPSFARHSSWTAPQSSPGSSPSKPCSSVKLRSQATRDIGTSSADRLIVSARVTARVRDRRVVVRCMEIPSAAPSGADLSQGRARASRGLLRAPTPARRTRRGREGRFTGCSDVTGSRSDAPRRLTRGSGSDASTLSSGHCRARPPDYSAGQFFLYRLARRRRRAGFDMSFKKGNYNPRSR